mmetsp:Transcript_5201/g.11299  ORF Transcript_5201/g.11299 Transcript_5201/m.11299 type:complete len:162 (-) Transcript_5201:356-841(-)|eukprot:6198019-Pleurochrysis_carterae.AAC.1
MARTDDVMNVAGHRLSSGQIEQVVASHPCVAECAIFGVADAIKGQLPLALVVLSHKASEASMDGTTADSAGSSQDASVETRVSREVRAAVRSEVGHVASLAAVGVVKALPKTRSGKILRGVLQKAADGTPYRLPGTIADASVMEPILKTLKTIGYARDKAQ